MRTPNNGVNYLQLDHIVAQIERAFGGESGAVEGALEPADRATLQRLEHLEGFQDYLQDQIDRQIIRDYLTNAVVLGFVPVEALAAYHGRLGARETRSALALHMLMSAVEQAPELLAAGVPQALKPLVPTPAAPPYMKLVQSDKPV